MSQAGQFYISSFIATLTGDTGGAITPVAGNIDILGGPGVRVDGTAGTLTIVMTGSFAESFPTDAGTAVPVAGVLNVLGGANINTTGVGDTITVILDDNVTLAGQLEADSVESITYVTAGTDITAVTGNISSVAGNVTAGGSMTAVGDITTSTGDLNAVTGDADIGGAVNSVGNITSSAGDVIAENDIQSVTGDITASAGAGDFATTVTAGTGITSTTGDIVASSGNMDASGTITAGTGLIATTGGVLASAGDITATLGNILTSAGSIDSASTISAVGDITTSTGDLISTLGAGSFGTTVTAAGDITTSAGDIAATTGTITASGNIRSVAGNIFTSAGTIDSASTMTAVGDITTSTGDLVATLGDIRAPNGTLYVLTFSATGDIVTTGGNFIATIGDVRAGDEVTSGGRITAGTGLTVTAGGILIQDGDLLAVLGKVTAQDNVASLGGGLFAENGDITAGYDVVAGADISSILGDITAEQGDVLARHDVEALEGDIIAHAGDIRTLVGFIRSADALIADANLDVTGTVRFRDIVNGGLIADADGYVTASGALTHSTGFESWTGAGAYYDDSVLGSFEVLRGGTGYINSVPITWAGAQTVTGMTAGNTYLIYMDDTGTIGKTTAFTMDTFDDYIVLFQCLRDSSGTNIQYTVKENHPYRFCSCISWYLHEVIGTVIENNEQGANITLNGTQKVEIVGADELADHGLYTDIPDGGGTAETWNQMLTDGGGKWITYQSSDTFNGFWNSAGTATAPSGTKFSVYTLYVSKDDLNAATPTFWAILDDQEYNNQVGAETSIANGLTAIATAELAELEFAQLGYIIYKQSTNTIVEVIIAKETLRSTISGGAGTNIAALILTDTTNFDGILSGADTNVQASLDTIDDWGASTTDHSVLIGNGVGTAIGSLGVATDGQLIIGSSAADPVLATLTAGAGITIANAAGSITLSSPTTGGGLDWVEETTTTLAMAVGTGYIMNNAGLVTGTLPNTAAVGSVMKVAGKGAGGWKIAQNAGEEIKFGTATTTNGAGGSLASTDDNDCVEIVCITADTVWLVLSSVGNITVV